tara:strand:- start:515 stop:2332 length:1818 start_codon:yes stop_codon:yes gene_type:complete
MELVRYSGLPTTISLFFNVIFNLLVLSLANIGIKRLFRKTLFKSGELSIIYVMLSIASGIGGHSMMQILPPMLGHPFWFATEENDWKNLFWRYLPEWLTVNDKRALAGYYEGDTLYKIEYFTAWLIPVLSWFSIIFIILLIMLCLNVIIRRQWVENEKLSYPIIQLPTEMTNSRFYFNRWMWIGFILVAIVDILNGLHFLIPNIPQVFSKRYYLNLSSEPFLAMGNLPFALYPFVIGLGFLIPLDLSFSCWFFFWFWKLQLIVGQMVGLSHLPGFPYLHSQAIGGYIGVTLVALYVSRFHLLLVIKQVLAQSSISNSRSQIMSYRKVVILLTVSSIILLALCQKAGMSITVATIFFLLYYLISMGITRMRAELGAPVHDIHYTGPEQMMVWAVGTRRLGTTNLTVLSLFWFLTRTHYSHVMPHQLEGFKISTQVNISQWKTFIAIIVACVMGIFSAFWVLLHIPYQLGALAQIPWPTVNAFGLEPWRRLENWLINPMVTSIPETIFIGVGMLVTFGLMFMRMKFFWFPLYPAAYAVTNSWAIHNIWFCLFIAWVIKIIILQYGGLKAHQKATPFFLGLILGEFTIGSLWTIIGILLGIPTYGFYT